MPLFPQGYFSTQQPLSSSPAQPPEFQTIAERDAWYRANAKPHSNAAGSPAFQPANPNDPYYQRSDIAPAISATNRDVRGAGQYGARGWMNDHPFGTGAALLALTAAGGALGAGAGAGAAGGGAGGGTAGLNASQLAAGVGNGIGGVAGDAVGNAIGAGIGAGAGSAASGWGNSSGQLTMGNASDYGAANHGLVMSGGAGNGVPSWLTSAQGYLDKYGGLLGGGGGGGGAMPMPSMGGGFMGSQQQPPAMQGRKQPAPLPQARVRFHGYQRTPMNFNGVTVWV